jgi:hypothetical protein
MAGGTQRARRPACGLQRRSHPVLLDLEMHVRPGPEAGHRLGREPPQAGPARLERARLQHPVTAPEDLERGHHGTPETRGPAPADRQHGCEDTG